ncbi:Conserved_hypothetical protein [Hexamita inflata]|uniref:Uncharacterized protein n=1 Tax=Hexamita inflata TaxID=28002 RepID=A0AA86QXS4_9EUKA|nr:Conserved hypothetical protein [Hexamita inflata]
MFGISEYKIVENNQIYCELFVNKLILLDKAMIANQTQDEIYKQIFVTLRQNTQNMLTEIIYDPLVVSPEAIKEILISLDVIIQEVDSETRCLRQLNTHSKFSFTFLQFKPTQQETDLVMLLIDKKFQNEFTIMLQAAQKQEKSIKLVESDILESYLCFFSFVLLIQYKLKVWLSPVDDLSTLYIKEIQLTPLNTSQLHILHRIYCDFQNQLSGQMNDKIHSLYGSELEIFNEEYTADSQNDLLFRTSEQSLYSQMMIKTVKTKMEDGDDYEINDVVKHFMNQYLNHMKSHKQLTIDLEDLDKEYVHEFQQQICEEVQKLLKENEEITYENEMFVIKRQTTVVKRRRVKKIIPNGSLPMITRQTEEILNILEPQTEPKEIPKLRPASKLKEIPKIKDYEEKTVILKEEKEDFKNDTTPALLNDK